MQTHNSYSSPEKCNPIQPYSPENYQKEENYQEEPPPPFVVVLSLFLFIYRPSTNNG